MLPGNKGQLVSYPGMIRRCLAIGTWGPQRGFVAGVMFLKEKAHKPLPCRYRPQRGLHINSFGERTISIGKFGLPGAGINTSSGDFCGSGESLLHCLQYGFAATGHVELAVNMFYVRAHSFIADE